MSHRACSIPDSAARIVGPGGKRVPLYIMAHRCSMRSGSWPPIHSAKSCTAASVARSGPTE